MTSWPATHLGPRCLRALSGVCGDSLHSGCGLNWCGLVLASSFMLASGLRAVCSGTSCAGHHPLTPGVGELACNNLLSGLTCGGMQV